MSSAKRSIIAVRFMRKYPYVRHTAVRLHDGVQVRYIKTVGRIAKQGAEDDVSAELDSASELRRDFWRGLRRWLRSAVVSAPVEKLARAARPASPVVHVESGRSDTAANSLVRGVRRLVQC